MLALLAGPIAGRVSPRPGAWLLALTGVIAAASTTWALLLLSVSLVDDIPGTYLEEALPIADPPSVAATGALLIVLARLVVVWIRRQRPAGRRPARHGWIRGRAGGHPRTGGRWRSPPPAGPAGSSSPTRCWSR